MFERNRTDNRVEPTALVVTIETTAGTTLTGKLMVPNSHAGALDALNSPGGFIEFTGFDGETTYLAKGAIASIKPANAPRAPSLNHRGGLGDEFDPHQVLGVSIHSTWDEIRAAYLKLSKIYHPDLFATVPLPSEVATYMESTSRRINAAYATLDAAHRAQRRIKAPVTAAPVYTSTPRA